jgi:hypothetical protein
MRNALLLTRHSPLATRYFCPRQHRSRNQKGYALLLVLFLLALVTIAATAVTPSAITQGKREKEEEMIWRGKQYVRGIKLFYRKNGRFPTQLDDLTKPKTGSLRFMRQAYKDPMNKEDGSWRLIYVGPAGQLIGSLKPQSALKLPGAPQIGTSASAIAGQNANQPGTQPFGAPAGASTFGASSGFGTNSTATAQPGAPTQPGAPGQATAGQPGQGTDATTSTTTAALDDPAVATPDSPTILGGNIIGVGSKINQRSVKIFEKAKNYRLFEFIWDPSKDVASALGAVAAPNGATPGATPAGGPGTGFGTPINGPGGPGTQPNATQPGSGAPQPPPMPPTQENPPNPPNQ